MSPEAGAVAASTERVVKRATDGAQAARILAESELLAAAQVPGVVELVGVEGDAESPRLVTTRVDGPDLGRAHDLSVAEVAGVVAAVATTVADLHDLGLVHGALVADHVLIGPDGRPVLCGFGHGGRRGVPPVAEAALPDGFADPARQPGDPLSPAADVYAIGALVRTLVSQAGGDQGRGPRPSRRVPGGRRLRRRLSSHRARRLVPTDRQAADALLAVADRATVADPRLRLGARSLAAAVGVAVPSARLPRRSDAVGPDEGPARFPVGGGRPAPSLPGTVDSSSPPASALQALRRPDPESRPPGSGTARRRLAVIAGSVVAAAVIVVVVGRLAMGAPPRHAPTVAESPGAGPLATAEGTVPTTAGPIDSAGEAQPPLTPPAGGVVKPGCGPLSAALSADTDGDGCPEALRWSDGAVEAGDRRWTVGQPGDLVATADWSCSGHATLALLRPATGDVFVFDGWAGPGHDLVAEPVGRVEGGFAIRTADTGDGCPRVSVDRTNGPPVTLAGRHRP
jgi:hypothetical protein